MSRKLFSGECGGLPKEHVEVGQQGVVRLVSEESRGRSAGMGGGWPLESAEAFQRILWRLVIREN